MFDNSLRRATAPLLDRAGRAVVSAGIGADGLTLAAFAFGLASAAFVAIGGSLLTALALFLAGRALDGLDGTVARLTRPSDRGGYLDIVLDFAIYGAIPFAFAWRDPGANALPAAALLLSFYVNGASFLAFAALAAKRRLGPGDRGPKAIHFTAGLMEGGETILAFSLMMLWPSAFPLLAWTFAALCALTALARIWLAWRVFGRPEGAA